MRLIKAARAGSYRLGIKIVRGAYLEKENDRAQQMGYPTSINPTKEATDREYNKAVEIVVENIDVVALCVGIHNEESCQQQFSLMTEKNFCEQSRPYLFFSALRDERHHQF
jgi:proline dehydrogenase